jgi:membrane fusion protein (multidrug efflux system)
MDWVDGWLCERPDPAPCLRLSDATDYREGSAVHKGDVLFEIDARPFQVALDQTRAQQAQAQAQLLQSQSQVTQTQAVISQAKAQLAKFEQDIARDTPLAQAKAIAQSKLDDDLQARSGAEAAVSAAQAQSAACAVRVSSPRSRRCRQRKRPSTRRN